MRDRHSPCFSDPEMRRLKALEPAVRAALIRQWGGAQGADHRAAPEARPTPAPLSRAVEEAIERFGAAVLSAREREIVRLILHGEGSGSIARTLGISVATVQSHRKHTHAKLQVSSEAGLYRALLEVL